MGSGRTACGKSGEQRDPVVHVDDEVPLFDAVGEPLPRRPVPVAPPAVNDRDDEPAPPPPDATGR